MRLDPHVVEELRALFMEGATPSRLIKHIIARHEDEEALYPMIQHYFREAFLTPLLQVSPELMLNESQGLNLAFLNVNLLHLMSLTQHEWNRETPPTQEGTRWFDGVSVRSDKDSIANMNPLAIPELAKIWDKIDEEAKRYIQRAFGNAQGLYERVLLLAKLAEQLQQQINRLQDELCKKNETDTVMPQST
jgi:hypothetical protein